MFWRRSTDEQAVQPRYCCRSLEQNLRLGAMSLCQLIMLQMSDLANMWIRHTLTTSELDPLIRSSSLDSLEIAVNLQYSDRSKATYMYLVSARSQQQSGLRAKRGNESCFQRVSILFQRRLMFWRCFILVSASLAL